MKNVTLSTNPCTGRCDLTVKGSLYQGRLDKLVLKAFKAMGVKPPPKALWHYTTEWSPKSCKDVYVVSFVADVSSAKLREGLAAAE